MGIIGNQGAVASGGIVSEEGRDIFGKGAVRFYQKNGTFAVPAGITKVRVSVFGAGGGAGQFHTNQSAFQACGGGGGGGFATGVFDVSEGTVFPFIVGLGGGVNTPGGATSFGALLSATGGGAGSSADGQTTSAAGGAGGTGTGGYFQSAGGAGGVSPIHTDAEGGGGGGGACGTWLGDGGNGADGSSGGTGRGGGGGGVAGGHAIGFNGGSFGGSFIYNAYGKVLLEGIPQERFPGEFPFGKGGQSLYNNSSPAGPGGGGSGGYKGSNSYSYTAEAAGVFGGGGAGGWTSAYGSERGGSAGVGGGAGGQSYGSYPNASGNGMIVVEW